MQNDNQDILLELKKLNQFNSNSKKYLIGFMLLIGISIIFDIFVGNQLKNEEKKYYENKNKLLESRNDEHLPLWRDIQDKLYADDVDGAIKTLEKSVTQDPNNYYNQAELADYYLRMNKPKKALEHFEKAYNLIPLEKYQKIIFALKKRLEHNS